jgi:hypothetical protein
MIYIATFLLFALASAEWEITSHTGERIPILTYDEAHAMRDIYRKHKTNPALRGANGGASDIIVHIGKSVWDFIQNNKPTVDYKSDWAGAIPPQCNVDGVYDWTCMGGFKNTESKEYTMKWKIAGNTVSEFSWKFAWDYDGYYGDHVGKFIMNAGCRLTNLKGGVNQDVKAWVETREPVNLGTPDKPLAGLDVAVYFSSSSVNADIISCTATTKGDGDYDLHSCSQN